jgi:hypothetical protein
MISRGERMKRFFSYLLYTILMAYILLLGVKYETFLKKQASITFDGMPYFIFSIIFPVIMGLLFGLPQFIKEMKKDNSFTIDLVKLATICLPAMYF